MKKILKFIIRLPYRVLLKVLPYIPFFKFIHETKGNQSPNTFHLWFWQKLMGFNKYAYWPVHMTSRVVFPQNVYAGIGSCPGYMPGCYIQAIGKIYVGDYTLIAPRVGIISANHELGDSRKHTKTEVRIGRYCWIGMGAVILPNVTLGDHTIVGANAVVNKSFPQGYCVIAGNPAKVVKTLDPAECVKHRNEIEYNGYIPAAEFEAYREKHLKVGPFPLPETQAPVPQST